MINVNSTVKLTLASVVTLNNFTSLQQRSYRRDRDLKHAWSFMSQYLEIAF